MRQSDRVLLVAAAADERAVERATTLLTGIETGPRVDVTLVHPAYVERASGSQAWSAIATRVHHVRFGQLADLQRVARHVTRTAIGVALSGGGARGIAHLGVLAALVEAGIPIDYICGTSMGAIFAAGTAQGWSMEKIRTSVRELFGSRFALYDPIIPSSSLLAGRKLDRVMQRYYEDAQIEDLWIPFFCVSTDLAHSEMVVHERGPLWQSVRASCSIPGIFPPLPTGNRLLVDGGLVDNLPVDLLAERCPGSIIAVDVHPEGEPKRERRGLFGSRGKREAASPPLFDVLIRSTLVGSRHRQLQAAARLANVRYLTPPVAAYGILSWSAHAELFDIGYRYATEQLDRPSLAGLAA